MANLSVHWEMLVTGGRLGVNGLLAVGSGAASMVTSAISTKSSSSIFLATLGASEAAGLNGPGLLRPRSPGSTRMVGGSSDTAELDAAAASNSRPVLGGPAEGVKIGSPARVLACEGASPSDNSEASCVAKEPSWVVPAVSPEVRL